MKKNDQHFLLKEDLRKPQNSKHNSCQNEIDFEGQGLNGIEFLIFIAKNVTLMHNFLIYY